MSFYVWGGVYLDTDVELFEPLDKLLKYDAVYFFETERCIASGLGFAAVEGHKSVKACLEYYMDRHFVIDGKIDQTPSPVINTVSLCSVYPELHRNGQTQMIDHVAFLSPGEFNQMAKHHGTGTWIDGYRPKSKKGYKDNGLKRLLRREETFNFVEKHFGKSMVDIYTFIAYDLLEYGMLYFIKRKFYKRR